MSQVDVIAQWKSPRADQSHLIRLRVRQEGERVWAMLSAPLKASEDEAFLLNHALDQDFQDAAMVISKLFALKPFETLWLREVIEEGKPRVYRMIMDERNGELINFRSGTFSSIDSQAVQNLQKNKQESFSRSAIWLVNFLALMVVLAIVLYSRLHQEKIKNEELTHRISQKQEELQKISQKLLSIHLVEKERELSSGALSRYKKIYRQSSHPEEIPLPVPMEPLPMTREEQKNWVELWQERLFKSSTNR